MACNCGQNKSAQIFGPGHDCNHVNHVFDPNPPAFYGTWKPGCGCGKASTVVNPGISVGLYKCGGPLHCSCGKASAFNLTGVETKARLVLEIKLSYVNSSLDKTIIVEPGYVYSFDYLETGVMKHCTGLVTDIYRVEQVEQSTDIYKIRVDCSANYSNLVVVIKTDQIRGLDKYNPYADADKGLKDGTHMCGTSIAAKITDCVITNAELDKNKNIVKGDIQAGTLQGCTMDGIVEGTNKDNIIIAMTNAQSTGGSFVSGYFLNGIVCEGDIEGDEDPDTGYVTNATVRGTIRNAMLINTILTQVEVDSVKNQNAGVLTNQYTNLTIIGTEVEGEGMVTTGGITVGDITTGGVTKGGTATGGTAVITTDDDTRVAFTGGTTTGDITTTGGTVVGGVISGGTRVGNVIYNAVVTGGVLHGGTTTGGTTTYDFSKDQVRPASSAAEAPYGRIIYENPNWADLNPKVSNIDRVANSYEDLILMTDRTNIGDLSTNFGTCTMETLDTPGRRMK